MPSSVKSCSRVPLKRYVALLFMPSKNILLFAVHPPYVCRESKSITQASSLFGRAKALTLLISNVQALQLESSGLTIITPIASTWRWAASGSSTCIIACPISGLRSKSWSEANWSGQFPRSSTKTPMGVCNVINFLVTTFLLPMLLHNQFQLM